MGAARSPSDDRAQTTIDFAVGASVFLVVVAFVVAFVPGIFSPFTDGGEELMVADRAADRLVGVDLAAPDRPYVLDQTCTLGFFEQIQTDGGSPAPSRCRFDTSAGDLGALFGTDAQTSVNVTVTVDGHPAVVDGVNLRAGDDVPQEAAVAVAQRTVMLDGKTYSLYVRVW